MTLDNQRAAFRAYLAGLNRVLYGTAEPTAAQVGEWFDRRHGLWLPVRKKEQR